jgi:carbon monoxide dehydrogenase subunit G
MADRTEGSIEVDAPPAAVMAEILDHERYPEWSAEIKKVEVRERDEAGRGRRVFFEVAQGPLRADYVLEYAYRPADAGVSWRLVEGRGVRRLDGEYALEPVGDRTRVTYRLAVETPLPILGFVKRQIERRIIDVALKGLKRRVEARRR